MIKKRNLLLRIGAFFLALFIAAFLLFITNSLVGNPISAAIAKNAIKDYVNRNYANLHLTMSNAAYNFKFGEYLIHASSSSSTDTNFTIYYRRNGNIYDDYAYRVTEKGNTQRRMEEEYSALVKSLLSSLDDLQQNTSMVLLSEKNYNPSKLQLDMPFDRALFPDAEITIRVDLKDTSLSNIARILEEAYQLLHQNGCSFQQYHLFSQSNGILVMIDQITPDMIENGNLTELLQNALNREDSENPSVVIKVFGN